MKPLPVHLWIAGMEIPYMYKERDQSYEDPYENHFGDKAFLVKYCIYYLLLLLLSLFTAGSLSN